MAVSWGIRISAIALLAAVSSALAVLLLGGSSVRADADAAAQKFPTQARYLLRLTDLPHGYNPTSGTVEFNTPTGCAAVAPSNPQPELARFLQRGPRGCAFLYLRSYRVPG